MQRRTSEISENGPKKMEKETEGVLRECRRVNLVLNRNENHSPRLNERAESEVFELMVDNRRFRYASSSTR